MERDEKKVRYVNYLLTLGFIFLIVILLVSMVLISRFVLSDSSLGTHVQNTKDLLEDVSIVESSVVSDEKIHERMFIITKPSMDSRLVDEFSKLDFKNNKSVVLFTLSSTVLNYENLYYVNLNNYSSYIISDIVVFNYDFKTSYGRIIEINDDSTFMIFDSKDKIIIESSISDILGKLIYIDESNNSSINTLEN